MLFIVDEASGVADEIMEAILGTLSGGNNKLLMCGNPTRTSGTFYDSHTANRGLYRCHKVSSLDSSRKMCIRDRPPAICYIDDRALTFDGHPETLLERIVNFRPWYQFKKE